MPFQARPQSEMQDLRASHFLLRLGPLVGKTIDDFLPLRFSTFFLPLSFLLAGLAPSTSMVAAKCERPCLEPSRSTNLQSSF